MKTIAIVTPWFEHPELEVDYVHAMIVAPQRANDETIVVDNGSREPLGLAHIRLDHNSGFCHASNVGLFDATADVVLFLNNDIAAVSAGWLDVIRAAVEPGVLVGACLRTDAHADVDGQSYPYLDGWCLAGMREDLLELDGFDDSFDEPAYYSDNDLCLRARAAGMTLRAVDVPLLHKGSVTTGPHTQPHVWDALMRNRQRYFERVRELVAA